MDERASREVKQFSIFRNDHHHVRRNASAGVRLFGAQLMAAKGGGTNHLEAADDQDCRGGGDHPPQEVSSAARHIPVQFGRAFKKLSRLDEFSCDAVANALVADPKISARAMALLTVGPQLMSYLNFDSLMQQAREVDSDKYSKKAERHLTHPLLLRRLSRFIS